MCKGYKKMHRGATPLTLPLRDDAVSKFLYRPSVQSITHFPIYIPDVKEFHTLHSRDGARRINHSAAYINAKSQEMLLGWEHGYIFRCLDFADTLQIVRHY